MGTKSFKTNFESSRNKLVYFESARNGVVHIQISAQRVAKKKGVVILDLEEYQQLCERAAPTYYLTGKAAERLDNVVREGLREYKAGKTRKIKSLADLD